MLEERPTKRVKSSVKNGISLQKEVGLTVYIHLHYRDTIDTHHHLHYLVVIRVKTHNLVVTNGDNHINTFINTT